MVTILVVQLRLPAECGSPTRVPFQPKGYKPVYCTYCFRTRKGGEDDAPKDDDVAQIASA